MSPRVVARILGCSLIPLVNTLHAADIQAVAVGTGTNGFRALVKDDRPSTPLVAPASKEGEIRIQQFKPMPGLKVGLWAAEPMLANPVAFAVDEKGRVFTSETYRYRTSVLDIRHYMFMLEDDLAARSTEDRLAQIRKWFGPAGERALSTETEVIRRIEDTDGDHRADRSSIFAEGFTSPLSGIASGVLARNGEVWFTEIPSLWRFRPATTDETRQMNRGKTSLTITRTPPPKESALHSNPHLQDPHLVAEELLRGFGIRFSYTGHDLHGLKFGPDGRLYFSCGDRGAHVITQEGTLIDLPDEGAVFRCEPDGSHLEVVHRGLRNPQELAFNEHGDLFTGDNDSDQGDRERWVQIVEGADSGWRVGHQHAPLGQAGLWNLERLWVPSFEGQAAYLLPPIANIGDGPSGLVFDSGTCLPESLRGRFLLAYFKGTSSRSGIGALQIRPSGAGYELVAHDEFLWNSLVPDVDLTPDGAILFADWHEGWPKSNKGRLYRAYFPEVVTDPVVRETALLLGEGFTRRRERELLDLLAHRDMRVRQEAQFELARRGATSLEGLRRIALDSTNQLARIHAIWGLGQILRHTTNRAVLSRGLFLAELFTDADPEIQTQSLRVFGELPVSNHCLEVSTLTTNSNARVRTAAWGTFPRLLARGESALVKPSSKRALVKFMNGWNPTPKARPAGDLDALTHGPSLRDDLVLAGLVAGDLDDPVARQAKVEGLSRIASHGFPEMLALADTHADPRIRMLGVLARRRLRDPALGRFLQDRNPLVVLEAARAIHDLPVTNALPALAEWAKPERLDSLLKTFASWGTLDSNPTGSTASASTPTRPAAIRDIRADQPLPWSNAPVELLSPMLLRVVNANFRVGTPESAQRLASMATRKDLPERIRTECLLALGSWPKPPARDRLVGVFRPLGERDITPAREALAAKLGDLMAFEGPPPLTPEQQALLRRAAQADPGFRPIDTRWTTQTPASILTATAEAVARLRPSGSSDALFRMVASKAPVESRARALQALAEVVTSDFTAPVRVVRDGGRRVVSNPGGDATLANEYGKLGTALSLAGDSKEETLRLAASTLETRLNPGDAVGRLAVQLSNGSPAEQQAAFTSLGGLASDAADALLADWLDRLMKREVANEVMLDLVEAASKRRSEAVTSRLEAYGRWKLPQDHLTPYRETLFGGDANRGRKVFYENAAVACTRCHRIGNDGGGNAGPVLDGLANRTTREHLLESIVYPNRQILQGYETALISLKDGTAAAGVVKSESDSELVLIAPEEGEVRIQKSQIASRDKGLSGMPEGLGQLLSRQELRDVVEFLGSLK